MMNSKLNTTLFALHLIPVQQPLVNPSLRPLGAYSTLHDPLEQAYAVLLVFVCLVSQTDETPLPFSSQLRAWQVGKGKKPVSR